MTSAARLTSSLQNSYTSTDQVPASVSTGALVVATAFLPAERASLGNGRFPRVDYVQLAEELGVPYIDYDALALPPALRRLEVELRLDIQQALFVARLVRKTKVNLVVSLSERVGIPLSFLLGRNVKHIVKACHPLSFRKSAILRLSVAAHPWDLLNVYTQAEAQAVERTLGVPRDRIMTLSDPVDTYFFRPRAETASPPAQDYIVSSGVSHRDYPTLLRTVGQLPHVTCEIYAASIWSHHPANLGRAGIPGNVSVHPKVGRELLRERYAGSRFAVVPIGSTSQWSAGATAVAEAQAMGKAVIATRTPGMSDFISDGETGLLVEPGDHQSMAEAIDFLWRNPERAEEIGTRAREWAESRYGFDRWLALMVAAIKRVAEPSTLPSSGDS